ncbi:hypothetical protein HHI36_013331 [Cryptolaemus montrouzieri]|uniref:Small ribosomal subunit protein uS5 n=1 Tax=Cryptolaemus montrouzieri TaxID=559131 RepID=A0ABD2NHB0_9CUCU
MWFCHCKADSSQRGTGIVSAPVPRKLLQMAAIEDCYTSAQESTGTLGNFANATYAAIAKTYAYLASDLWKEMPLKKTHYQEFADYLAKNHRPVWVPDLRMSNHVNVFF